MALLPDERRDRAKVNAAVRDGLRLGPRSTNVLGELLQSKELEPQRVAKLSADDIRSARGNKKSIEEIRAWLKHHGLDLRRA